MGTPLREGRRYTLVVDRAWPDARGNPLGAEARKAFRVGPPDYTPPRTQDWRLAVPGAGTLTSSGANRKSCVRNSWKIWPKITWSWAAP